MIAKRNARLAAVQVIFQYFFSRSNIKKILKDYEALRKDSVENKSIDYDKKLFEKIIMGVYNNEKKIRDLIEKNLSDNWPYDRVDHTMTAIISLGIYELSFCFETPHKVIIDEYVSISGLFFNKKNIGFVNGLLDKLSKLVRDNERN